MTCTVMVGGFFGDEGKGKIASYLAVKDKVDLAVRGGVGTNAGHTVLYKGETFKMRMIPTAFVNEKTRLMIGPGVLVDPKILLEEIELTNTHDRIRLDPQCCVIEEEHKERDRDSRHLHEKIGSTGSGCGPCNADRVTRTARIARGIPELRRYLGDVPLETNTAIDEGGTVLIEGTQGTFLSLFHGTYPYCTSKDVTASAICSDVGVGPTKIDDVIVVFKSYTTRVGAGPLDGEIPEEEGNRRGWSEVATVTGRKRRSAPFNPSLARRAVMLNGATQAALTKLDILFPDDAGKKEYEELSSQARKFVDEVEEETRIPVTLIGTGPSLPEVVDRREGC